MFLGKGVLKIFSKFTGEHPCRSAISIKLQSNFIKITLRHWCSPVIRNFSWGELKKIESKIGNQSKKLNFYLKKKRMSFTSSTMWDTSEKVAHKCSVNPTCPEKEVWGAQCAPMSVF